MQFIDNKHKMSLKIVFLALVVSAYQVNGQVGGIIRPFATGFTNGFAEVAKPFMQFGQPAMPPANDFFTGQRFPFLPQMMTYPSKIVQQPQATGYEGLDAIPPTSYFQAIRPPLRPQNQIFQIPTQPAYLRPIRPLPATAEESIENYRPSSLLNKPEPEAAKSEEKLDAGFEGPSTHITKE